MQIPAGALAFHFMKGGGKVEAGFTVKHGAEILEGPYPKRFADFVGQTTARTQILAAVKSAAVRKQPMDHMLLASGQPGIGKTALGRLAAECRDVGFLELGGKVREQDAAAALKVMNDGDVMFIDEIHRLGKAGSEWLLTLMQDGTLQSRTGVVTAPRITIIAATTEAQKLPRPLLERFPLKPILEAYTLAEAVEISKLTATRLEFGGILPMPANDTWLEGVATACDNNPRRMGMLLTAVRDYALAYDNANLTEDGYDITTALEWSGLSRDGIDSLGQQYLVALLVSGTTGIKTLQGMLSEERLEHTEADLVRKNYVAVTGRGRELTEYGRERARALAAELVEKMEVPA